MASTYEKIATTTLGSATATVTFSSISASYTDLVIIFNGALTTGFDAIAVTANNDTGSNYSRTFLTGDGSTASSSRSSNASSIQLGIVGSENSNDIFQINNYSNTTTYKTFLCRGNSSANQVRVTVGLWRSTAAINRLDFVASSSTFIAGSTFTLYGIKSA